MIYVLICIGAGGGGRAEVARWPTHPMRTETSQPKQPLPRLFGQRSRWRSAKMIQVEGRPTMFGSISISPAQLSGTDATTLIAHLDAELAKRYPGLDRDTFMLTPEQVRAGHGVFLIAKAGGEPVGCGALRRLDSVSGEIKRMYVVPSVRGARVGRRLLTKLEWYARQLGMYRLVLHTGLRQPEAIQLYKSTGFARIAGFGKYNESSAGICVAKTIILPTRPGGSEADGRASQIASGGDRTGG